MEVLIYYSSKPEVDALYEKICMEAMLSFAGRGCRV
jgi:hypothetical protein